MLQEMAARRPEAVAHSRHPLRITLPSKGVSLLILRTVALSQRGRRPPTPQPPSDLAGRVPLMGTRSMSWGAVSNSSSLRPKGGGLSAAGRPAGRAWPGVMTRGIANLGSAPDWCRSLWYSSVRNALSPVHRASHRCASSCAGLKTTRNHPRR